VARDKAITVEGSKEGVVEGKKKVVGERGQLLQVYLFVYYTFSVSKRGISG